MFSFALAFCLGLAVGGAPAAQPVETGGQKPAPPPDRGDPPANPVKTEKKEKSSEADLLIRLQQRLAANTAELDKLKEELEDPRGDYGQADAALKQIEKTIAQKDKELAKLKAENPQAAAPLEEEIHMLEKSAALAHARFDIAVKEKKVREERAALLTVKIAKTRQAIALLEGPPPAPAAKNGAVPPAPTRPPASAAAPPPVSLELQEARKEAETKNAELKTAKDKVKAIEDRILLHQKSLDLDRRTLDMLRLKASNAAAIQANVQKELDQKRAAKAANSELAALVSQAAAMAKLAAATRKEIQDAVAHEKEMDADVKKLEAERTLAEKEVDLKSKEAEQAAKRVKFLESPLAPRNVEFWAWRHVPAIVIIVAAIALLQWLVRLTSRRIVKWMVLHKSRGSEKDRENRADTLVGVFRNRASFLVFAGGAMSLLQELGIPILPVLGGAAAGGLAVAFGAQNVIKDYLAGFYLLLEDQYGIGDVVKVGGLAGQVEGISLRRTVLRDNEGTVHFIPHGIITTVSNMTHRWSRAFFEIRVAYKEDVDRVMEVLLELCRELRADPAYGPFILEEPEMLGVDQFSENGITIQFQLRTGPLKQWSVKRELLRRIKKRFDELDIGLPHLEYATDSHPLAAGNGQQRAAAGPTGKTEK